MEKRHGKVLNKEELRNFIKKSQKTKKKCKFWINGTNSFEWRRNLIHWKRRFWTLLLEVVTSRPLWLVHSGSGEDLRRRTCVELAEVLK